MKQLKYVNTEADARKTTALPSSDTQKPPVAPYKLERVSATDNLQSSRSPSPNKQAPPVEAKEKVFTHRNSIQTNNKAGDKRSSTQINLIGKKSGSTISVDSAYATSNEDVRADMKRAVTTIVKTK